MRVRGARIIAAVFSCLWGWGGAPPLYGQGQVAFASLSGSVEDDSGSIVPDAMVVLSSPEKSFSRTFTADQQGRYAFTLIPAGTYTLRVTHPGFRAYTQSGIQLAVGQAATLNVQLSIGEVTQEVTVAANALTLNVSNANIATDVTERQVMDLPLDYRAPFFLVTLKSSVNAGQIWQSFNGGAFQSGPGADQDASAFTFGGSRFGATGFLLDGHWNGSGDWDAIMYSPTVDETQEFKIQDKVFTAQYGLSMGNVVNAITKSGSSKIHGSGFEFLRNDKLDANNFFNNRNARAKPAFKRNQFGGTFGGPVYIPKLYPQKDKTFVFGSYEGLRQGTPLTLVTTLPAPAFRNGDFSALLGPQIGTDALGRPFLRGQIYNPFTTRSVQAGQADPVTGLAVSQGGFIRDPFPGNIIPANLINPVAKAAAAFYPQPTSPDLVNNFASSISAPVSQDKYTARIDHNVSDKIRFFGRWSQTFEFKQRTGAFFGPDTPAGPGEKAGNNRYDLGVGSTFTFSPTFIMSVAAGLNRWVETRDEQSFPYTPSILGFPTILDQFSGQFPRINIQGVFSLGGGSANNLSKHQNETVTLDFTKIHGEHSFSFGFQHITFLQNNVVRNLVSFSSPALMTQGPDPTAANAQTGLGFASFLLGTGNAGGFPQNSSPAFQKTYNGWYFQDEWRISRKLTATLGLRYDIQFSPTDRFNRLSSFDFAATNPIEKALADRNGGTAPFRAPGQLVFTTDDRRGLYDVPLNNFAPRVSLAYRATENLVARTGFGVFFIPSYPMFNMPLNGFSQTTPFVGTVDNITPLNLISNPFPTGLIQPPGRSNGPLSNVGLDVNAVGRQRSSPYVEQWTFSLGYAVTHNDSLDISYVGNHGVKLNYGVMQRNQLQPESLSLGNALLEQVPNPFFGLIGTSSCGLNRATVTRAQLLRPFPQFCSVNELEPLGASSWYHGMTAEFNHRFAQGIQFLASYTWSKYLDNSQGEQEWVSGSAGSFRNFYNLAAEKSLDANDVPHSLVLSYIMEVPAGKGRRFGSDMGRALDAVVGGWQISGVTTYKSGLPLGITAQSNNTNSFGGGQRPNLIGDPSARPATVDKVNQWFNPAAFAQPAAFTFGNVGRFISHPRGPGLANWDIGISKHFVPRENFRIQLRAEAFNAFNHANFFLPNTTFGDPGFGRLNQTLPARDIQFGLKLLF